MFTLMKVKRERNKQFCALKLDMMKDYDRSKWSYLEAIMLRLGFNHHCITSIMNVVSTVSFLVLLDIGLIILNLRGASAKVTLFLHICFC
jgi:hypothetical protein